LHGASAQGSQSLQPRPTENNVRSALGADGAAAAAAFGAARANVETCIRLCQSVRLINYSHAVGQTYLSRKQLEQRARIRSSCCWRACTTKAKLGVERGMQACECVSVTLTGANGALTLHPNYPEHNKAAARALIINA
jgi:hypothetical protein